MTRSNHVRCTFNERGAILFDTECGKMYNLNATAAEIWKLLDQCDSSRQIVDAMLQLFPGAPIHSLEADVNGLLGQFQKLKLVLSKEL